MTTMSNTEPTGAPAPSRQAQIHELLVRVERCRTTSAAPKLRGAIALLYDHPLIERDDGLLAALALLRSILDDLDEMGGAADEASLMIGRSWPKGRAGTFPVPSRPC